MDIQLASGKNFYEVDSQIAQILCELNLAQPIAKTPKLPAAPKVPTFGIGANKFGETCIVLTLPDGSISRYDGRVEGANDAFKSLTWNATEQKRVLQGPEPSDEVVKAYESRKMAEAAQDASALRIHNQG